jgi:hypothetical protein
VTGHQGSRVDGGGAGAGIGSLDNVGPPRALALSRDEGEGASHSRPQVRAPADLARQLLGPRKERGGR